jgi:hypothetical protein
MGLSEEAAFTYALLQTPAALYPRSVFRRVIRLSDADYTPKTLSRLDQAIAELRDRLDRTARGKKAFTFLILQDVERARRYLAAHDLSRFDAMTTIDTYYGVAEDYYPGRLGLPWTRRAPVVVDRYPPPAENEDWFAVSHVPGGPRAGYPQGIYFLRRHMMPGVTELATLHENTHLMGTGSQARDGYHRFFDEGCANFFACLVHAHHTGGFEAVDLFRAFLIEINTALYEYPSFERIIAIIVHELGLAGLYRLLRRRLREAQGMDWSMLLRDATTGQVGALRWLRDRTDTDVPPIVSEMEDAARRMVSIIMSPSPALMSPLGYLAYVQMCEEGSVGLDDLRTAWRLADDDVNSVAREGAGMSLWVQQNGRLVPLGMSYLFRDAGLVRASASRLVDWTMPPIAGEAGGSSLRR